MTIKNHGSEAIPTLSLFSGAGGLDLGFHAAGFDVVAAIEIEPAYCATLQANSQAAGLLSGTRVQCCDVRDFLKDLEPGHFPGIRCILGGPPCQTFSAAGRRSGGVLGTDDKRGQLFEAYCSILEILTPEVFVFENVYGLPGANGGGPWAEILESFSALGYTLKAEVLDAADYGVPQHRERLIMVGYRDGEFTFPLPTHGPDAGVHGRPLVSAGAAIADLQDPDEPFHDDLGGRYGHLLPLVPPGLNYSFFTKEMGYPEPIFAWRSKFHDLLYKVDPSNPVRTIKARPGKFTGPFHWKNRHFTLDEYKRLQSFPDHYEIIGGQNRVLEQIGNSVPPRLAETLATSVREQLLERKLGSELTYPVRPAGFKSTFRLRQRDRTHHFKKVAANEIESRFGAAVEIVGNRPIQRESRYMVASGFFTVEEEAAPRPVSEGERRYLLETVWETQHIEMSVTNVAVDVPLILTIAIDGLAKYLGSIDKLSLTASLDSLDDLFHVWTFIERALISRSEFFTFIDIYGHYANRGDTVRIRTDLQLEPLNSLERAIQFFGQSENCGSLVPKASMQQELGVDETELEKVIKQLRGMRFDVRIRATHPTIAPDHGICTYPFPLLSEKAHLQRRVRID